jgi:Cdc6-like AAA superfamily ATPase
MQVEMNFPNIYILPNLKTQLRDGAPDKEGPPRLRDILTRRVEETLFTSNALTALAELSSGIPRELIALARRACLEARKSDRPLIDEEAVKQAARSKRMDYQVLLTTQQLDLLRQVQRTKRVENDEAHRALLHNLSALEYRNDEGVWYDVHPLIKPLLAEEHK